MKFLKVPEKLISETRRGPNPEGSYFHQFGRVLFLPIRKGPIFANPEGSYFCQSESVLFLSIRKVPFLPIRKSPNFANPEGFFFCQSGSVLILPMRKGPFLSKEKEKQIEKNIKLLGIRLETSDCTGNLPLKKTRVKKKQV